MHLDFSHVWQAAPFILKGAVATIELSVVSFLFALVIAYVVGTARARRLPPALDLLLRGYLALFRGTPLLVQLFLIYYGLPQVGITLNAWVAATLGLALNSGAYMSEIVRASLLAVDPGQVDAAYALGYTRWQTLTHVIFKQATRVAIPPLTNSLASLLKESSLVSVLAITELTRAGNVIYSRTMAPFEIYLTIAFLYLLMTTVVTVIAKRLEKRTGTWAAS